MLRRSTDEEGKTSKVKGRIAGGAAVVAAVSGLLAAHATPAFASGYWETQTDGATGVSAWGTSTIPSDGDCDVSAHITDTKGDGHRAGVQVHTYDYMSPDDPDHIYYYLYNTSGSGTTVDRSVWDVPALAGEAVYVREFVSEGAIENGGYFVDRGAWKRVC